MKRKSFPFEYEKYIVGTAFLNRREKGAYVDLLCYQADKGQMTLQDIKNILNGDFDCWGKLKGKFIEDNGIFFNRKMKECTDGKKIEIPDSHLQYLLKQRKDKFYQDIKPSISKYPPEMLRRFFDYWTEINKSGARMRFELEQVFEISKRLSTWARKDNEFNKTAKDEIITHIEMMRRYSAGESDIQERYELFDKVDGRARYKLKKQ